MGRILPTRNRNDFLALDRQVSRHRGIVACTYDPDTGGRAQRIEEAMAREQPGGRRPVRVYRPNQGAARKNPT